MTKDDILNLMNDVVSESGIKLSGPLDEVAQYAATRAQHLSGLTLDPGFELAVRAERDNVMLKVTEVLVRRGDAADLALRNRLLGLLQGSLAMGAKLLAVA